MAHPTAAPIRNGRPLSTGRPVAWTWARYHARVRRAARFLFTLCSAVSLALLVASCVLWVRSRWYYESYGRWTTTPISAHHGELLVRDVSWNNGNLYATWMREGVMVRELQHGNRSGPIPLLEANDHSGWTSRPAEHARPDYGFEWDRNVKPQGATTMLRGLGVRITRRNWPPPIEGRWEVGWEVLVPFWMLATVFAMLPAAHAAILVRRRRRRRRAADGRCVRCGYDLRASPERCPECGTASGP